MVLVNRESKTGKLELLEGSGESERKQEMGYSD